MSSDKKVHYKDLPYRPCVGIVLLNDEGKVFVGERIDRPGAWQMPQGGIDEGEEVKQALYREMLEEIGTDKAEILEIGTEKLRYDLPDYLQEKLWNNRYRGQEQVWVALKFTGKDSDINLNAHNPAEFMRWKWVSLNDILDLIVPFKRDTYKQVIDMFEKHI